MCFCNEKNEVGYPGQVVHLEAVDKSLNISEYISVPPDLCHFEKYRLIFSNMFLQAKFRSQVAGFEYVQGSCLFQEFHRY